MRFMAVLTYFFACMLGALAFPQLQSANPALLPREGESCGTYKDWSNEGQGKLTLRSECENLAGGVYSTRVVNPKCAACFIFSKPQCSGEVLWMGGADHKDNYYYDKQVSSYYCKSTFP
ncbi:hypothetical protein SLS60_004897 [Paraconiothyrium brasiliense]|uniref:Uncharacterized protein n=1 Tax=Paraconiothyrium brasiliense TaxID=300254 RepID=A0ABR3RLP7_9PLEO